MQLHVTLMCCFLSFVVSRNSFLQFRLRVVVVVESFTSLWISDLKIQIFYQTIEIVRLTVIVAYTVDNTASNSFVCLVSHVSSNTTSDIHNVLNRSVVKRLGSVIRIDRILLRRRALIILKHLPVLI